jgi:hypothetical protein
MIFPEVKIYQPDIFTDFRGDLLTLWNRDEFEPKLDFKHNKISTSRYSTLALGLIVLEYNAFPINNFRYADSGWCMPNFCSSVIEKSMNENSCEIFFCLRKISNLSKET